MKASYKIALLVSVIVCVLAVVLFKGKTPQPPTQATNDTATNPDTPEPRKTLRSDSQGDGTLKSMVNTRPANASNKPANTIAADARNRILAANASNNHKGDTAADQATPSPKTQNKPTVLTIGSNTTGGLALARTEASPTTTTPKPQPSAKVTNQALDAIFTSSDATKPSKSEQLNTAKIMLGESTTKPEADVAKTYTVLPGDLLSTIAVKLYDDERRWVDIAQANPKVEPTRLQVGQVLRLPDARHTLSKEEPSPPGPGSIQTYKIQAGDSLSTVAQIYYQDPTLWRTIYNHNRQKIGDNPNAIQADTVLEIPPRLSGAQ